MGRYGARRYKATPSMSASADPGRDGRGAAESARLRDPRAAEGCLGFRVALVHCLEKGGKETAGPPDAEAKVMQRGPSGPNNFAIPPSLPNSDTAAHSQISQGITTWEDHHLDEPSVSHP